LPAACVTAHARPRGDYGPTGDTGGLTQNHAPTIYAYPNMEALFEGEAAGGRKAKLPGPDAKRLRSGRMNGGSLAGCREFTDSRPGKLPRSIESVREARESSRASVRPCATPLMSPKRPNPVPERAPYQILAVEFPSPCDWAESRIPARSVS
jgi:hypothetical protein